MDFASKYSRYKPNLKTKSIASRAKRALQSDKNRTNKNGHSFNRNGYDYYHDDYKSSSSTSTHYKSKTDLNSIRNERIEATGSPTSFYGMQSLNNAKRIFGDDKFNLYQHMKELFAETSTGDINDLLQYLEQSKSLTSDFLSKKVKYQYKEFISMSRNVLEIEDQMTEMDDMLKSMSTSMKSLHETNFKMLQRQNDNINGSNKIGINEEEQRDREQQEMEVLESMHEQILQHIQLRQLQQATDLIVTAKNEQVNLKQSARKRAMQFINNHIHELEALIVDQLSSSSYLPEIKRDKLSTLLMKLGFVDQAMELFLEHKSKALKQTIRQISLYGDVKQYIQDLSKVFFDEIINSTIQYTNLLNKIELVDNEEKTDRDQQISAYDTNISIGRNRQISTNPFDSSSRNPFDSIPEDIDQDDMKSKSIQKKGGNNNRNNNNDKFSYKNSMHMSRLIVWIYKELETYEKLFEQQVFQLEQNDFRTIGECLKIVFKQSTRLDQSGIHVSFLLSNHFQPSIEAAINRLYKKKLESIKKLSRKENFISKSKNVSNAANKNIGKKQRRLSIKYFKKKALTTPASNPFTQTERKRSAARYSRISRAVANTDKKHARRSSEIFGDVVNIDGKEEEENTDILNSDDENMEELRKLSHARRMSKTKIDEIKQSSIIVTSTQQQQHQQQQQQQQQQQYTVVKLTKSGQEMYEIVKKCIQETWRLLDQRYYSELTKSVYRTVVTQMIYLVQVYSSQITSEINERAPKDLTTYRKNLSNKGYLSSSSSSSSNRKQKRGSSGRHRRNSSKSKSQNVPTTIKENEQFGDDEKSKDGKKDTLQMPSMRKKKDRNSEAPKILSESQMLSLIANVYYVSEDLLNRIAVRYQKLFGREIPELELFAIEQQKLYKAQFQQFAKKFLYKWVNDKFQWIDDKISNIYGDKSDISIITKEEIATWSVSKEILGFVRYIVNLRLEIDKYLGGNKDIMILRDSIEIFLNELYNGDYIPNINNINKNDEIILISPFGLNKLYLDFRFLMITLHNFMSTNSKQLCTSICEKAKKYVNYKYNLQIDVDWKLMHTLGMKLQYKALTGDELDVLNKTYLSENINNNKDNNNQSDDNNNNQSDKPTKVSNPNNPFL